MVLRRFGAALAAVVFSFGARAGIEVGQPAPDWSLIGSDNEMHTLSDYKGMHVVISFFPKAFTGG